MSFFDRMFGMPSQERASEPYLPPDSRELLIRYAKQAIVPRREDAEAYSRINYLSSHIYVRAASDPTKLYTELSIVVARESDWVSAGAAWFIKDLGLPNYQDNPLAWALMDLATRFLRARNIPVSVLAPIQANWWRDHYPNEQWLTYPPLPDRSLYPIADLAPGQERPIVRWVPLGSNNTIVMKREEAARMRPTSIVREATLPPRCWGPIGLGSPTPTATTWWCASLTHSTTLRLG